MKAKILDMSKKDIKIPQRYLYYKWQCCYIIIGCTQVKKKNPMSLFPQQILWKNLAYIYTINSRRKCYYFFKISLSQKKPRKNCLLYLILVSFSFDLSAVPLF